MLVRAGRQAWHLDLSRCNDPRWEHRPFRDINRSNVAQLLDQIADQNGARQADVCLAVIRKLMNWFAARDDHYVTPIVKGMHRSNGGDHKRKRILSDDEIRALWKAADGTFGALLKVALLTAQRREKVATMKWSDIDGGVWTIAMEKREKANAGRLQLPQAVLDIIEAQPRLAGNEYVFAAGKRRSARSLMARADVSSYVAERVLGHAIVGVEGTYDRHGYDDEKGKALAALAALVERFINPRRVKVVDLVERRQRKRA